MARRTITVADGARIAYEIYGKPEGEP